MTNSLDNLHNQKNTVPARLGADLLIASWLSYLCFSCKICRAPQFTHSCVREAAMRTHGGCTWAWGWVKTREHYLQKWEEFTEEDLQREGKQLWALNDFSTLWKLNRLLETSLCCFSILENVLKSRLSLCSKSLIASLRAKLSASVKWANLHLQNVLSQFSSSPTRVLFPVFASAMSR